MKRSKEKVFFLFSPRNIQRPIYFVIASNEAVERKSLFSFQSASVRRLLLVFLYLSSQVPESIPSLQLFCNRIVDLLEEIWYAVATPT
jgi:hypothetical protein